MYVVANPAALRHERHRLFAHQGMLCFRNILAGLVKIPSSFFLERFSWARLWIGQRYMGVFVCPSGFFYWAYNKIDPRAPMAQLVLKATCSVREDEMTQVSRTRQRYVHMDCAAR